MSIRVQNSDGGKVAEGFAFETNDCTVRALANASGLSYKEAHRIAKASGRHAHRGLKHSEVRNMLTVELTKGGRYEVVEIPVPQATIVCLPQTSFRFRLQRVGGMSVANFLR